MSINSFGYENAKLFVLGSLLGGFFQKIYVEAWNGVGAIALLREVAVESKKREFDTVIRVVRPAPFQNPREIQRAVVEQLNLLSPSVKAAFDAADEDDDFSGVEFSSRDQLSEVADEIYRAVEGRRVLLILCNNIADAGLIDPNDLGIPIVRRWIRNAVMWTSGMNISREAASASADLTVMIQPPDKEAALDLVYKEAVEIARYIEESSGGSLRTTPQVVLRCFWYCLLLLRRAFDRSVLPNDRPWEAAANYLACDETLEEDDAAWEIGKALAALIGPIVNDQQLQYWQEAFSTWTPRAFELLSLPPKTLLVDSITQEDWVKSSSPSSSNEESYGWISVRSPHNNIPKPWDFFSKLYCTSVLSGVSSFFGHFEKTHEALPNDFFDYFSNVRVLDLLGCLVSPINPSFLRLRNLRMLRLERCEVTSLDPSHPSAPERLLYDLQVLNLYNSDANKFLLAGEAFELMPNLLELNLTEHINTEFLSRSLSMAINLKELILTNCEGLEYLNFNLPTTIETISLQRCASLKEVELVNPAAAPLPNLKTFHLSGSKLIAKLSLQGCHKLENVDLQELKGLEVLDLSCTAIKAVDISKLPQLKQLFLLKCEQLRRVACRDEGPQQLDVLYLDNYKGSGARDVDQCLDSFRNQRQSELTKGTNDADQRLFHAHVVVKDVRLFLSLGYAFYGLSREKSSSHIHVKGSSAIRRGTNSGTTTRSNVKGSSAIRRGTNSGTTTRSNATTTLALCYADVSNTMTGYHRRHHSLPPTMPLSNHIEVDGGHDSRIVEVHGFRYIMEFVNSLFVHSNTSNFTMDIKFRDLKCLRIERCPNIRFIFETVSVDDHDLVKLESIWLSHLPRLKALCKQVRIGQLKHIHLEFCTRLEYVFPSLSELHDLETINIRYCNDLTAIFISDDDSKDKRGAAPMLLPKLRSIHLQELPKLQHIYKANICAPSLEELKFRGCFNLRKLPLFRQPEACLMRAVKISCEQDWWDKLQWDRLEFNHRSSHFNPKHCPYYKKRMKARWF
ncbi:uncharacterized protein LOC109707875 [Ananas comosus]|uniref:Uncharacterized protein LOC109707875 n=1 Tax=Ananas comosus TaxID=4615 RepID=A0A6P5ENE0_ANACO|nr:uncharacterized protein LOC109707875 [Ananas comosus]XP_020085000.1 uncharacterized protein LOC109707875 [Ananas comosus]XP_020085007.1 uncharacterized protein LOC109707875 [Ananas comosus]